MRADHLGSYGYARKTSPNMDALAADGTLFLNAVSPAPWTLPTMGTIWTSLYPSVHGATRPSNLEQWMRDKKTFRPVTSAERIAHHPGGGAEERRLRDRRLRRRFLSRQGVRLRAGLRRVRRGRALRHPPAHRGAARLARSEAPEALLRLHARHRSALALRSAGRARRNDGAQRRARPARFEDARRGEEALPRVRFRPRLQGRGKRLVGVSARAHRQGERPPTRATSSTSSRSTIAASPTRISGSASSSKD